jgi:hypothetical protein
MGRVLLGLLTLGLVLGDLPVLAAQGPPAGPLQGRGGQGGRGFFQEPRDEPEGTAIIRGRIVSADTGSPIRRAQIRAVASGTRSNRLVSTDADGRFELRDLSAGRWQLTASKAGFVTLRFGQRRPFEAGQPIEIRDGQLLERADFSLPRGAAITGRVFDEFGDPVAGARLQALRYQPAAGSRRLAPIGVTAQSDDTGAFRLFGLMPGDYYVSATLRALPVDDPDDVLSYAPTYFPGTGRVSEAQAISLGLGEETAVNFGLLPVRTARVSGTVLDSTGNPLGSGIATLGVTDADGAPIGAFGANARIRPDGTFAIINVPPGSYTLTATNGVGRGAGPDAELAAMPVTVAEEDLTGITLITSRGATLTGAVVVAEGGVELPALRGMQIAARLSSPERDFGSRPARVGGDGTFALTNLFGRRVLQVTGLPQGWMLKAVLAGGADIADAALEFGPSQEIRGAEVVITNRVTEVTGTVTARNDEPTGDYTVVIFPDDEPKWAFPSRYVRAARPDQQGVFKIPALPPHDRYLAVAVNYLEEGEAGDPEFLRLVRPDAARFALADGESKTIDLGLIER